MKNNAADYCKTISRVSRRELVNALHQSLMQLSAAAKADRTTCYDHAPAISEASRLLERAGHIGFTK